MQLRTHIKLAIALSILSFMIILIGQVPLTDICFRESVNALKCNLLHISGLLLSIFIGLILATLIRVLKRI